MPIPDTIVTIKADREKFDAQIDALHAEYKKNLVPLQMEAENLVIKHHQLLAEFITKNNDWIYDLDMFGEVMEAQLVEGNDDIFFKNTAYVNNALTKNPIFNHDIVDTTYMAVNFKDGYFGYLHSLIVPEVDITKDTDSKTLIQVASDIEPYLDQLREYLTSQDEDNKVVVFIKSQEDEDTIQIVSAATGQYSVILPNAYHQDDMLVQNQSLLVALSNVRDYKKQHHDDYLDDAEYDSFGL